MAFIEDDYLDESALHSPIWGAFALVRDSVETLVAINLAWSVHLIPLLLALGFTSWPLWIRGLLSLYTILALGAVTGPLYRLMMYVGQREPLHWVLIKETFLELLVPSMQRLAPLYSALGAGWFLVTLCSSLRLTWLDTVLQVVLLWLIVSSFYWGPLFAAFPDRSPVFLFRRSWQLIWRYPGPTARSGGIVLCAVLLGVVSIGGIFLIAPVLVFLLQTLRYQALAAKMHK